MTKFEEFNEKDAAYFQTKMPSVRASSTGAGWFVFIPFMKIVSENPHHPLLVCKIKSISQCP